MVPRSSSLPVFSKDLVALERVDRAGHREVGLASTRGPDAERQIVLENALDVLHLVRRASVQVLAARQELGAIAFFRRNALQKFGEAELNVVDGEIAGRAVVEVLKRLRRARGLLAAHGEARAAARDRDVERRFDLAQVGVQRAAQARQALVVDRIEFYFRGFR